MSCIFEKINSILETLTKKPLKVLNASAGSGKTYHLVKEYLKLLINNEATPIAFSNVIAMTFTNKAALEMKERIIQALDTIGSPDYYDNKSEDLTNQLALELSISPNDVAKRCSRSLEGILHRYEEFHVMTIDKFNLKLIKSFGRDLDLPNDFEVIMDESELIEKIVDDLLNQLGEEGSKNLNDLIFSYAKTNIDDGNQWNFRRSLVDFGRILRSEKNNDAVERLLEMDFSLDHFGNLRKQRTQLDEAYIQLSSRLQKALDHEHLEIELLPGKSRTLGTIQKILGYNSFPIEAGLTSDTFLKNLDIELKPNQSFPDGIKLIIREIIQFHADNIKEYASLDLFMKNFFNMALLQYMARALKRVRKEEQLIRISEFNTLISELIQNESTPFIYERMGTKFHHFLLDEFQDTSRLQWLNMVPLVLESISQNKDNLIVGDPKQSIYRFKNGVAEQFVELPSIYNPEKDPRIASQSEFFKTMGQVSELSDNWRSSPCIVNFNNGFFTELRSKLPETTAEFYNSIEQNPMSNKNGRVYIISQEEKKTADELNPLILGWVQECLDAGFKLGEICILGNTNRECNRWALGLNSAGYSVVSTDSLLINSSLKVQLTIAFLKRRLNPSGENEKKRFAELYFRIHSGTYADYRKYIVEKETKNGKKFRVFDDHSFLDDHFNGKHGFFFKHESLYDLVQQFYKLIDYNELSDPYLHHLADIVFDYGLHKGPDLKGFLKEYEGKKNKIAVQIPESDDAIQLMTIHKSKGLEFPVVIVPSMNFSADVKSHFLVDIDDFVVYKKPLQSEHLSVLQNLYNSEREQVVADNVNKCYVAMTRPIERLYVGNFFEKKSFGNLFNQVVKSNAHTTINDDGAHVIDLINGDRKIEDNPRPGSNVFHPSNITDHLWFPDIALQDTKELRDSDFLSIEIQFGIEFHLLASRIEHSDLIKTNIQKAIQEGVISKDNAPELELKLSKLFKNPEYNKLFEDAIEVLNEQSIIQDERTTVRPDKLILKENETILLDFKTGIPSSKDTKQVQEYKLVLEEIGFPSVSCYLFYSGSGELLLVG